MALHIEWVRFKRECLRGLSKDEIAAIKNVYYAGAAAAAHLTRRIIYDDLRSAGQRVWSLDAIGKELERWRALMSAKASAKKGRK